MPMIWQRRSMFSRPVSFISKPAVSSSSAETRPFTVTVPLVGAVTPVIILSAVDLPAPLRPKKATASPFLISKLRSLLASTLPRYEPLRLMLNRPSRRARSFLNRL